MKNLGSINEGRQSIQAFCDLASYAKSRLTGQSEKVVPAGYADAVSELLMPDFKEAAWAAFVSSATEMVESMSFIDGPLSMVLVVLPCSFTPMIWERRDLVAGKHLGLIHYSLDQWQANEPLIAAIPAALWQAGRIDLPANIAERRAALLAGLEMARTKIKALLKTENL
jgi:hypothetical protein